ncbi:cellulase family glycosylhydrolase [Granulicella sibirica]|uniref:Beta-1,4-mannanase n=1 Tax=Granulicella sibirica TaxID=2479048 RepID=A0A4Q0SXB2_9BACT|nr:cellulase family glycosylhydrolase [Granulicella sibirica]RXH55765.1 Beta-1,4-mannanase [Granulicella sibirica]
MPTHPNLYVSGRFLHTRFGTKLILRGIDLPLLDDWNFPGSDYLDAVAQSNANAVRIQWYVDYGQAARPPYSLADLDTFLHRCAAAEMVPILMLADLTCAADTSQLNPLLVAWWTNPDVVAVLQKHARYLIINIANEVGFYHWTGDDPTVLDTWLADYTTAITSIRAAGLNVPLMIDATDCGSSLDIFLTVGAQLIAADPQHNILLSAHAYWAGYDGLSFINQCVTAGLPILFGEMSNIQDGDTDDTYFSLDENRTDPNPPAPNGFTYQALLAAAFHHEIGWLAWSWGPDKNSDRQLSTDGTFPNLTPWGQDFLTNPTYGLATHSHRYKLL